MDTPFSTPFAARAIVAAELAAAIGAWRFPLILDVRREPAFAAAPRSLPGAIRRAPEGVAEWAATLELGRLVVAACVHGHEVSQGVAAALAAQGHDARFLDGGIEGWRATGRPMAAKPGAPSLWVTRARPKVDRIACPWLIRRFIDPDARILFVPADSVLAVAAETGATAFDAPGAPLHHRGERCSLDAIIHDHAIAAPGLARLAAIVRGADTDRLDLAPECAGLFAAAQGYALRFDDDQAQLRHGLVLYDALHAWCMARDAAEGAPA